MASLALLAALPATAVRAQDELGRPTRPAASSLTAPAPSLQGAAYQPMPPLAAPGAPIDEAAQEYQIPLEPPGPDRIFRLESEAQLMERMRQEARNRRPVERITFPDEPILSKDWYAGRSWPPTDRPVEPNYVCYERLLFEQKNFERYGWDLGPIAPVVSFGTFFADFVMTPYNLFKDPCRCWDANAGYCLPGDPVPLLLYPPELSVSGAMAEAAAVLAIVAIFP
jgi:hypothetical protein